MKHYFSFAIYSIPKITSKSTISNTFKSPIKNISLKFILYFGYKSFTNIDSFRGVKTNIKDSNRVSYILNLIEKYKDTNEWVEPISNNFFALKEQT